MEEDSKVCVRIIDTENRWKAYPKGYLYGKAELNSNGPVFEIEVLYTP